MLIMKSDRERFFEIKLINDIFISVNNLKSTSINNLKSTSSPDTVSYEVCGIFNNSRVVTVLSKHNTKEEAIRQIKDFFDNWPKEKYIFGSLKKERFDV